MTTETQDFTETTEAGPQRLADAAGDIAQQATSVAEQRASSTMTQVGDTLEHVARAVRSEREPPHRTAAARRLRRHCRGPSRARAIPAAARRPRSDRRCTGLRPPPAGGRGRCRPRPRTAGRTRLQERGAGPAPVRRHVARVYGTSSAYEASAATAPRRRSAPTGRCRLVDRRDGGDHSETSARTRKREREKPAETIGRSGSSSVT